jgi:uncharacterized protein GlcG (DUF336 family)
MSRRDLLLTATIWNDNRQLHRPTTGESNMYRRSIALALAATVAAAPALAADQPLVVSVKRLSMDTAVKLAQASVAACREKGIQIGVTVVDRDGTVQVQLRDTIAPVITTSFSQMKAVTAANFNAATSALAATAATPIGRIGGLLMVPGGLPIQVGGALLGAVGVSGAAESTVDEECAKTGLDKVTEDLELAN